MKKSILTLSILVAFATNVLLSQSLKSQLKVIFGDVLSTYGKNDVSRVMGKALSTSGNMNYNMEMIQAQNKQELTINLPPNTSIGQNNQVLPNPGYQWANPSSPSDYSVMPLSAMSAGSYPTLSPYDLASLEKDFEIFPNVGWYKDIYNSLTVLFTYNWTLNTQEGGWRFSDFQNPKRTFHVGEPIEFAYGFIARTGSTRSGKSEADEIVILLQIFNSLTGEPIAKEYFNFYDNLGPVRYLTKIKRNPLGNSLPVGKYLISVNIDAASRLNPRSTISIKDQFEVIQ